MGKLKGRIERCFKYCGCMLTKLVRIGLNIWLRRNLRSIRRYLDQPAKLHSKWFTAIYHDPFLPSYSTKTIRHRWTSWRIECWRNFLPKMRLLRPRRNNPITSINIARWIRTLTWTIWLPSRMNLDSNTFLRDVRNWLRSGWDRTRFLKPTRIRRITKLRFPVRNDTQPSTSATSNCTPTLTSTSFPIVSVADLELSTRKSI